MQILSRKTKVLEYRPHSILVRQPCGCEYWYHDRRKLCPHLVDDMAYLILTKGWLQCEVAESLGLSEACVSEVLNGKRRYL